VFTFVTHIVDAQKSSVTYHFLTLLNDLKLTSENNFTPNKPEDDQFASVAADKGRRCRGLINATV
jgi:hypothetical protein